MTPPLRYIDRLFPWYDVCGRLRGMEKRQVLVYWDGKRYRDVPVGKGAP